MRTLMEAYRDFENGELRAHRETFNEKKIGDITDRVIEYERTSHETTNSDPVCQLLFNDLKEMFGAGFETSTTTLQWLSLYMVAYPHIQRKVHQEIDKVVGRNTIIELNDNKRLHYTVAVINEVMRLTTIVPFAVPHRASRNTNFMGFDIYEGTYVMFNLHSANHDSVYWEDPKTFRPERLLDEHGKLDKMKCSRVVSFGLGRRRCVGEPLARMQIFALFANMMQRCELVKPDDEKLDLSPVPGLVYTPKQFKVIVKARNAHS